MNLATAALAPLLAEDEPPAFEQIAASTASPFLLICDHASNFVPRSLQGLGLEPAQLAQHIAYDIGAAAMTRRVAEQLSAPAVLSHFSRLVIDPNRPVGAPTSIPEVSDRVSVPGNQGLTEAEKEVRAAACFRPYHQAVAAAIQQALGRGRLPIVVSLHSFTPVMEGYQRPWEIGVLWDQDDRLAKPMLADLAARGMAVGDNLPYSGRSPYGFTMGHHASSLGLPQVLLEVRQDLIDTAAGAARWGDLIAEVLLKRAHDPALTTAFEG
ncbi:MAG: N-formylglutamate amidohydrolase [Pseudomonadota bacterium]